MMPVTAEQRAEHEARQAVRDASLEIRHAQQALDRAQHKLADAIGRLPA